MLRRDAALVFFFVCLLSITAGLSAGEWPQWRGPARNGLGAEDEPNLAASWPKAGPAEVWRYPAPSGEAGGLGSVVVAGERAYVLVSAKVDVPVDTRHLGDGELRRVGWFPETLPDELKAKVEAARAGEERAALKADKVDAWVQKWLKDNLTDDEKKKLGGAVQERLKAGAKALPLDVLASLAPLKDKVFAAQSELDAWLAEHNIADNARKAVNAASVKTRKVATDTVVCLDAAKGAKLWETSYPGQPMDYGACGTPCIAGGRCYVVLSSGQALCLSAADGNELWRVKAPGGVTHASFVVEGNLAIVPCVALTAFDTSTGRIVWKQEKVKSQENSPVLWRAGEATYAICNTGGPAACVSLKDGNILWTVPGGQHSSAAVAGEYMAIFSGEGKAGLSAYRLSPDEPNIAPKKLWTVPMTDRGASPLLYGDCVYAVGGGKAVCVELAGGKVAWEQPVGGGEISSPILAGGKIIAVVATNQLALLAASPVKRDVLAKAALGVTTCSSPAIAGGKLYLRLEKAVACFDLTAGDAAASAPAPATKPGK
jgi:outer membrane protein assembly factor BamB